MSDLLLMTSTGVLDIKVSPCYIFIATESGLDIIDKDNLNNTAYVFVESGINCIFVGTDKCDSTSILLGTAASGVLELIYSGASTTGDLSSMLINKYNYPQLYADEITCLYRSADADTLVGTSSGIVYITASGNTFSGTAEPITACNLSISGDAYYGVSNSGMYVKYGPITSNWSSDYYLNSNTVPAFSGNTINSILLGPATASGFEVLAATDSGLSSYSENRSNIASGSVFNYSAELQSYTQKVYGLEPINFITSTSGSALYSTFEVGISGILAEFDLYTQTVINSFDSVDYTSSSGIPKAISGAKVLVRG